MDGLAYLGPERFTGQSFVVHLPRERIGVLIGPGGKTKQEVERRLSVSLDIDSRDGTVVINLSKPPEEGGDPSSLFKARDIATAIGRAFSPERAFKLFEDDVVLTIIDLSEYVGRSSSNLTRVRARLIGTAGKTRKIIEENCHVDLSIYGDTVAIIGSAQDVKAAEEAVTTLIKGAPHNAIYRMVDEYARRRKGGLFRPR